MNKYTIKHVYIYIHHISIHLYHNIRAPDVFGDSHICAVLRQRKDAVSQPQSPASMPAPSPNIKRPNMVYIYMYIYIYVFFGYVDIQIMVYVYIYTIMVE